MQFYDVLNIPNAIVGLDLECVKVLGCLTTSIYGFKRACKTVTVTNKGREG